MNTVSKSEIVDKILAQQPEVDPRQARAHLLTLSLDMLNFMLSQKGQKPPSSR